MLKNKIKSIVYSNKILKTGFWVIINHIYLIKNWLNITSSPSGSTHQDRNIADSVDYIDLVFAEYKKYGAIDKFEGDVLELGPGDNAGVALRIKADGASKVDLVDRFYSARDSDHQQLIYNALSAKHHLEQYRKTDTWDEQKLDGIIWNTKDSAEDFLSEAVNNSIQYDYIISRAVLEHVIDPLHIIDKGLRCLTPNGKMIHVIDFHDHSYYSADFNELTFLTIPSPIYPLMVKHCGGPNRTLVHEYKQLLEKQNTEIPIQYDFYVTKLFGQTEFTEYKKFDDIESGQASEAVDFINAHKPTFAKKFKDVASEDLSVSGVCLVISKR